MDFKVIVALVSVIMTLVGYSYYFRDIFAGKTKPHAYSWLVWADAILLNFKCECSDEECDKRIPIKLSVYKKIHENRKAFIIKLKHQVKDIEKVILTEDNYSVVEKNKTTAEPSDTLNSTTVDNKNK